MHVLKVYCSFSTALTDIHCCQYLLTLITPDLHIYYQVPELPYMALKNHYFKIIQIKRLTSRMAKKMRDHIPIGDTITTVEQPYYSIVFTHISLYIFLHSCSGTLTFYILHTKLSLSLHSFSDTLCLTTLQSVHSLFWYFDFIHFTHIALSTLIF